MEKKEISLGEWIKLNINVLLKLLFFTVALFTLPIATFYLTRHQIFEGNTTYAAGSAVFVANVIVFIYIILAMFEEESTKKKSE